MTKVLFHVDGRATENAQSPNLVLVRTKSLRYDGLRWLHKQATDIPLKTLQQTLVWRVTYLHHWQLLSGHRALTGRQIPQHHHVPSIQAMKWNYSHVKCFTWNTIIGWCISHRFSDIQCQIMASITLKSGLGVIGHWKWYHSKALVRFLIRIP